MSFFSLKYGFGAVKMRIRVEDVGLALKNWILFAEKERFGLKNRRLEKGKFGV